MNKIKLTMIVGTSCIVFTIGILSIYLVYSKGIETNSLNLLIAIVAVLIGFASFIMTGLLSVLGLHLIKNSSTEQLIINHKEAINKFEEKLKETLMKSLKIIEERDSSLEEKSSLFIKNQDEILKMLKNKE